MALTTEAALALLDGYEGDLKLSDSVMGAGSTLSSSGTAETTTEDSDNTKAQAIEKPATSLSAPESSNNAEQMNRFKRLREHKKAELTRARLEVYEHERTLETLLERHRHHLSSALTTRYRDTLAKLRVIRPILGLEAIALRQKDERHQAEQLNRQLKRVLDAALEHSRRLEARKRLKNVTYDKRFRVFTSSNSLEDAIALQMQTEKHTMWSKLIHKREHTGFSETNARRLAGCGLLLEAIDSRTLAYDLTTTSESLWRFFTTPIVSLSRDGRQK
ncbi:hypothetical protein Poli38472_014570 [Pythium oligandrum]|uniref:Uncharacterized protein n=1 Tax=Pythium oligandrum TaxID=41045 RepID=A0A8K1CN81_PYTOL|nr:hypothetical protein Poli38472_014570 [Pythium oligandrum]|eukprot:TMW66594.1 hypothetical protein Poli38472_014570 [Pythium oligandrum]